MSSVNTGMELSLGTVIGRCHLGSVNYLMTPPVSFNLEKLISNMSYVGMQDMPNGHNFLKFMF